MVMDIDMFFTVTLVSFSTLLLLSLGGICLLVESIKKDDND